MALTLTQARLYSKDTLQAGVIEMIARESAVLERLPFMEISGNSYKYNLETALPTVAFREVNKGYEANEGTIEQKTEGLVILGGDVDIDRYIVQVNGDVNNIRAIQTEMKAKAVANTFTKTFFKGDAAKNANEFDGLDVRMTGTPQVVEFKAGDKIVDRLHEALDSVEGGADVLYMSKKVRRALQKEFTGQTHLIQVGKDEFGRVVEMFGDVQIRTVSDLILNEGEIYAVKFGAMSHVSGLTNGGVSVRDLGELDTLPVVRTRIEWFVGLAVFNPKSIAKIDNIFKTAE
ncbi:phage major capsid protein [Bacillus thuringiensis]|uniref:major capsid protein n=1 Tax=Bacillus cereus group TaxID=86661 RepID=UPI000CD7F4F5|nr:MULTISPECIES: phage major capsid protein [Bacillus cereus group]MEC3417077.1 phage major capsid protein [Bacillus cereus]MEC3596981.1 phage major capsid protein [Bacillus thuringiensis]MED1574246.1 phage major capsid protein [Bacillus paranthracis]MED1836169.1 phage major capsid protein [Bacillus thuringiensis]MED2670232.1 phage major capsid protein [Bacillus thuringiensis]